MRTSTLGAVLAVALLASAGCTQSPSSSGTPQAQASATTPTAATEHEMHGPPGPERLLFAALNRLDLTSDQRTKIEAAAHSVARGMPDQNLFAEVAAGVRAGKIDETRILAALGSTNDRSASVVAALDTLHATLTGDQRRAFVDMIAEHIDDHEAAMATAQGPEGKLQHVLAKLNLRDDQRANIDKIVAAQLVVGDDADEHARMAAFHDGLRAKLDTFAADRFDAAAFAGAFPTAPTGMKDHIQRTLRALAAIVPVLDSAQRETLATMIEAGPQHEH